jgi:soluble lytic murein transglycosylase-like protein
MVSAGAAAAGQDETGWGGGHEMMLASTCRPGRQTLIAAGNKKVYICSILALAMLAASPTRAADAAGMSSAAAGGSVPASLSTESPKQYVVRVDPRTGKLVRRLIDVSSASKKSPAAISALVEQSARAHSVDPLLVHSIIQVESNYDASAVSSKGAEGLMQLMPPTARMLGVSNSFDPGENIEAGVKYLKYLQDLYKDDRLALAAYNAGPGSVDKYRQVPPYPETQKYVENVGKRYDRARKSAAVTASQNAVPASPPDPPAADSASPAKEPEYSKLEQFVDEYGRLHLTTAAPR